MLLFQTLINIRICRKVYNLRKNMNTKFQENPSYGVVLSDGQTDRYDATNSRFPQSFYESASKQNDMTSHTFSIIHRYSHKIC